jgi:hypothetical protein
MGYERGVYIKGLYPTSMDTKKGYFRDGKYILDMNVISVRNIDVKDSYIHIWSNGR